MDCDKSKLHLLALLHLLVLLGAMIANAAEPEGSDIKTFVSVHAHMTTMGIAACQSPAAETCERCTVKMDVLRTDAKIKTPDGTVLNRVSTSPSSSAPGRTYATLNGSSMSTFGYITYGDSASYANGEIRTPLGSYDLANCGLNCHVWIKENTTQLVEEEDGVDSGEDRSLHPPLQVDSLDRQNPPEVSVRVYFTPEFQAIESDVMGYITDLIEITNTGYVDSGINVRLKLHCAEFLDIAQQSGSSAMLDAFEVAKGTVSDLRNTTDIAFLLTSTLSSCGIAYVNTNSLTIGVSPHNCARSFFSFGHEIGHIFGAQHNREANPRFVPYPYGYGFLILPFGSGLRTVLAYSATGHETRINHYSSDTVKYENLATGNNDTDNARVITQNGARQAAVGDESAICVPTDGQWGNWGPWMCPYNCGTSPLEIRSRACNNPIPLNGGNDCVGFALDARNVFCNTGTSCSPPNNQAVDGSWSAWGPYSACSVTCDGGTQSRSRTCTDPAPHNGGALCPGSDTETSACNTQSCSGAGSCFQADTKILQHNVGDIAGAGSPEACQAECAINPECFFFSYKASVDRCRLKAEGSDIYAITVVGQVTGPKVCPASSSWSSWSTWSSCSLTCAGGSQQRTRTCVGGSDCVGSPTETRDCNTQACPAWSNWSSWSSCSVTCGGGTQQRTRTCEGGSDCVGSPTEARDCNTQPCGGSCFQEDTKIFQHNVGETIEGTGSPEACQAECAIHPECFFFSYKADIDRCRLKAEGSDIHAITVIGQVTGPKVCP